MSDETTSAPKFRILLVEDNDAYRKVVKKAMELEGYTVYEAENGLRGLEIVRAEKPDVVLCDVYMPVMDGMTMLKQFKQDQSLLGVPIVMLTNVQEELENAVKLGAEEALLKSSLTPHQLIEVCKKHLTNKSTAAPVVPTEVANPPQV